MNSHDRTINSKQKQCSKINLDSVSICENILKNIILQSYAILQHNRNLENMVQKQKKQQTILFSNKNYQKMLGSYYVSHQEHSNSMNQEKCFKNTKKKYCFFSQSIEKQKLSTKGTQTFINQFQKPYIIKKNTRLNTMNQTFQNQVSRSIYQRLSHKITQNSLIDNSCQNIMRSSMRPVITQNSPVKQRIFKKKLKKMSSTFFADNLNSNRKQSNRINSLIRNQGKLQTDPAETLISLIKLNRDQYSQIDRQIDILRQRRIKLQQVVNLFDSQNSKIIKNSDKIKIQKQLSSKRLNFTTDFDGTLLPLFQRQNNFSKNQNVTCKVKNLQQSRHEVGESKKKKTFIANQSQKKIQRKKINKKFSSLIQSSKKIKSTSNQTSQKHSKEDSTVGQIKSNKHQKQNNCKKITFEDEKLEKNFEKTQTTKKINQKDRRKYIQSLIESNLIKESQNDLKNQSEQMKNIQYNEVSKISNRWQRKQKILKKIQFSQINTKNEIDTAILSTGNSQEEL